MSKHSSHKQSRKRRQKPAAIPKDMPLPVEEVDNLPPAPATTTGRWIHALVALLLVGLCAGLYGWTADFPMVFDDHMYMKDNPFFQDATSFSYPAHFTEFVRRPGKLGIDPDLAVNFVMRPVAYASLYLNYLLDGFRPRWFRVFNIGIHAATAILVYALLRLLLLRGSKIASLPQGSTFFIPLTSALLFAAHPLATESVTYIIQRFTSLSAFFYLLTLWLYFASLQGASRWGRGLLRAASVVAVLAGMLTKESTFTAPLVAVLIDWLVHGTRLRVAAARAWPLLLCLPLIPALVLATSAVLHEGGISLDKAVNIVNSRDAPLSHWEYFVTQLTVVATYVRRIFWPHDLNLDPQWPLHRSLLEWPVLRSLFLHGALLVGTWWLWRRKRGADYRFGLAFVFVLWFFLTLVVSSGLVPLPDLMADHRTYLPSIGIFVLAACLFDFARNWSWRLVPGRVAAPACATLCVGALAWNTCDRNEVWRSSESLWRDTVAKSPGKYRTWGNLGAALSDAGKEEPAVNCYRKALEIEPRFQNGLLNLSNSLLRLNRPKESLETTMQLIRVDQTSINKPPVAFALGLGLAGTGRYDEALGIFQEILRAAPQDPQVHKALGLIYAETGLHQRALDHYQQADQLQPGDRHLRDLIDDLESAMASKRQMRLVQPRSIFQ